MIDAEQPDKRSEAIARGICNNLLAWLDERNISLTDEQFEDYGDEIDKALREYGEALDKDWARMYMEDLRKAVKNAEGYSRGVEEAAVWTEKHCEFVECENGCLCAKEIRELQRGTGGGE